MAVVTNVSILILCVCVCVNFDLFVPHIAVVFCISKVQWDKMELLHVYMHIHTHITI